MNRYETYFILVSLAVMACGCFATCDGKASRRGMFARSYAPSAGRRS